jgi:hypothetical protein
MYQISDIIMLTEDLPGQYLFKGQKGTIIEILEEGLYSVEFLAEDGNIYCEIPLESTKFTKFQ